ncbi:hypothetical protein QW71_17185 [Paenibacillus sp. IHB B 3415]|nr:hypothetical protein QW71_17185 [Paenibacillus sp. IHB B 3415]
MPDKECPPLTRVVPREFKPLVPSDNTLGMGGFFAVSPADRRSLGWFQRRRTVKDVPADRRIGSGLWALRILPARRSLGGFLPPRRINGGFGFSALPAQRIIGGFLGFAGPPGEQMGFIKVTENGTEKILELEQRSGRLYTRISTAISGSNQEIRV